MIKIVTGKINSQKTTRMMDLYLKDRKGDGFISQKIMNDQKVYGYHAMKLSSREKRLLMIHKDFYLSEFFCIEKIGPYLIHPSVKQWVEQEIDKMIQKKIQPIYLDEIGALELGGLGFDSIFKTMVSSGLNLIIVVREDMIDLVIKHYQLNDVTIIESSI
jgi:nucleoside-triphosphatase THEP1